MYHNKKWFVLVYCVYCHFQQYFSYIVAVSFIGGGNRNTQRKPPGRDGMVLVVGFTTTCAISAYQN
jgi:hypothetical protein